RARALEGGQFHRRRPARHRPTRAGVLRQRQPDGRLMKPPPGPVSTPARQGAEGWFPWVVGFVALVLGVAWAGAALAALTSSGGHVRLVDAGAALTRLPSHAGDPAAAWPPDAERALPGAAGFAIPALLEWRGPIIATSVKTDLLAATIAHRRRRGAVWIYDPTETSGDAPSSWSPLDACDTWQGATRTAAWMVEAAQARRDS